MTEQDRAVAIRMPLVEYQPRRIARPELRAMLLGGVLLMSAGMMIVTLGVGISVSRDVRGLVERFDRDASARAFELAAFPGQQNPRVYVLPALRKHLAGGRVSTRSS